MKNADHDIIASLWCNCTLGILTYWWTANKSQDGRGSITTTQMPTLVLLDPRKLSPDQIKEAKKFFDSNMGATFLPAHQIATDTLRAELDEFVLRKLLGISDMPTAIDRMAVLRRKLGGGLIQRREGVIFWSGCSCENWIVEASESSHPH